MSIGKNIKVLRLARGWTQEDLATQLHMTRQAVGHYESGRTVPDVDTCRRLAEIFEVELEVVLEGQKIPAKTTLPLWLRGLVIGCISLFSLLHSLLFWSANKFFFVPNGTITPEMMPVFEKRLDLLSAAQRLESAGYTVFLVVLLLWLVWELRQPQGLPWKERIHTGVSLLLLGILTTVPWALADPVLPVINYIYLLLHQLVRYCLAMVVIWGIRKVQKR